MNLQRSFPKLLIIFLLGLVPFDYAAAQVVINEIAWMGTENSANDEWIELYNKSGDAVNLDGWTLRAADGSPKISLTGKVPGYGFFLLERTDDTTVPYVSADHIYTGSLKNDGEILELYDKQGGLTDFVDCSSGWFAGDNATKQTMERKDPQAPGNNSDNWATSQGPGGTAKDKNIITITLSYPSQESVTTPLSQFQLEPLVLSTTTASNNTTETETKESASQQEKEPAVQTTRELKPVTYPSNIIINEILPSPEGADETEEWIELKNLNEKEVDLSQWKIQDAAGSVTAYTFPGGTKISPSGFLVLYRPTTKITLNNSNDGLVLSQPDGNVLDAVTYEKAARGQSYNWFGENWQWSGYLTPGATNILPSIEQAKEKSQEKGRKQTSPKNTAFVISDELKNHLIQPAAIGEQMPRSFNSLSVLLVALGLAIFSGLMSLILKKQLKQKE